MWARVVRHRRHVVPGPIDSLRKSLIGAYSVIQTSREARQELHLVLFVANEAHSCLFAFISSAKVAYLCLFYLPFCFILPLLHMLCFSAAHKNVTGSRPDPLPS